MDRKNTTSGISPWVSFSLALTFIMTSCTSTKKLDYFQDLPNTTVVNLPPISHEERVIENGDDLYIGFIAKDNAAAAYFNKAAVSTAAGGETNARTEGMSSVGTSGLNYLVDHNGYLQFPLIGRIKVSGLTAAQLKQMLTNRVIEQLKDPIVDVRFNTFRVTVLGEVRSPGTFTLPLQRTTLFEALAAAGDLPYSAKRYDVQLYRDYNGQRKITRIDLTKRDILTNQDVFQIKHNDVLYVKPRPNAVFREDAGLLTSVVSLVIGLITLGFAISNN